MSKRTPEYATKERNGSAAYTFFDVTTLYLYNELLNFFLGVLLLLQLILYISIIIWNKWTAFTATFN